MRHATERTSAELARHGEGRRALVLFHLANANGIRVFCRTVPPDALIGASGRVRFADGTWLADGSARAGEGSEALLGVHDWVLDGGSFSQGASPGRAPLDAFRERELSGLSLALSNAPGADGLGRMSRILATEPVVGGRLDVRVGFTGGTTGDVLALASLRVRRAVERREAVVLECEGT